jgi:hypothetical protein
MRLLWEVSDGVENAIQSVFGPRMRAHADIYDPK